jgi:hypothetical protein
MPFVFTTINQFRPVVCPVVCAGSDGRSVAPPDPGVREPYRRDGYGDACDRRRADALQYCVILRRGQGRQRCKNARDRVVTLDCTFIVIDHARLGQHPGNIECITRRSILRQYTDAVVLHPVHQVVDVVGGPREMSYLRTDRMECDVARTGQRKVNRIGCREGDMTGQHRSREPVCGDDLVRPLVCLSTTV